MISFCWRIVFVTDIGVPNNYCLRVRDERIEINEDNNVVSNNEYDTLNKAMYPLLVFSNYYGVFPVQNINSKNGSNLA